MVSMLDFGGAKMPLDRNSGSQHHFSLGLGGGAGMMLDLDLDLDEKSNSERETIHSGHFMVSEIDDSNVQEEEEEGSLLPSNDSDGDQDVVLSPKQEDLNLGLGLDMKVPDVTVPFDTAVSQIRKDSGELISFRPRSFQTISIDGSLTKLLECMSLVYSGKLTSPRWKTFKGVKIKLKEKIRLNNMIWRAWHLQFILKRSPFVCQFASPLEGETRNKPEAVVLEGKYLKRGMKTVIAEYKKCRMFYRDRIRCLQYMESNSAAMDLDFRFPSWSNSSLASGLDEDLFMDFSDTLFGTLIPPEPFDFPNPREIARAGIADLIQPGLVQLQPALDDFMDTFEPLHDFFQSRPLPPLPEEGPISESLPKSQPQLSNPGSPTIGSSQISSLQSNLNYPSVVSSQTPYSTQYSGRTTSRQLSRSLSKNDQRILKPATLQSSSVYSPKNFSSQNSPNVSQVSPLMGSIESSPTSFTPETVLQSPSSSGNSSPALSLTVEGATGMNLLPRSQSPGPQTATASVFAPKHGKGNQGYHVSTVRQNMRSLIQPKLSKSQQNALSSAASSILKPPKPISNSFSDSIKSRVNTNISNFNARYTSDRSIPSSSKNSPLPSEVMNVSEQSSVQSPIHQPLLHINPIPIAPATSQSHMSLAQSYHVVALQQSSKPDEPYRFNPPAHMLTKTKRNIIRMETPGYRRHSYTGHPVVVTTENYQVKAPTVTVQCGNQKDVQFAVPKGQAKQRARSRSVSSPQHTSTLKAISAKPPQAISLTNISLNQPVQSILPATPQNMHSLPTSPPMPHLIPLRTGMSPITTTTNNNRVMRPNTVLAQLLSTAFSSDGTARATSTSTVTNPTVTIIGSVPPASSGTQTLVLSPVTLSSVPGDIQNSLLVGTSGSVFSNSLSSQNIAIPVSTANNITLGSITQQTAQKSGSESNVQNASTSSQAVKIFRPKSSEEKIQYKEHKRVCHINAEQKRRCNIKHGFEALHLLVPSLCHSPNAKVSKAAMLQKAVDYIRSLKAERSQQMEEAQTLKKEIDQLNQTINTYQNQLPASGAPVPFQRTNHMRERFEEYVKSYTLQNWKFWIFSLLMEPLLDSYSNTVSTASFDDLCKTTVTWLDQHCSLAALRPMVLNSLRTLSTTTNILEDPSRLPEEATRAIAKKEKKHASK